MNNERFFRNLPLRVDSIRDVKRMFGMTYEAFKKLEKEGYIKVEKRRVKNYTGSRRKERNEYWIESVSAC